MKIAVLSDVHSAAEHFRDALEAARAEGFDRLVILGDLLTYGPDPVETIALAEDALSNDDAILIKGNHDLLYMDGPERDAYASRLPDWIRESVDWTASQLGGRSALNAPAVAGRMGAGCLFLIFFSGKHGALAPWTDI